LNVRDIFLSSPPKRLIFRIVSPTPLVSEL
jgi:hypothetical protein